MAKHQPNQRPQKPKSKERIGDAFTVFRPLNEDSADDLYELLRLLEGDGVIPPGATIKPPRDMRVTLLERRRMSKQLQGFAAGFNAAEAILNINDVTTTRDQEIEATLGKVTLMDRRDETIVARIEHNQVIAEEYKLVHDVLTNLHMPQDRRTFKPHVGLVRVPGLSLPEKEDLAKKIGDVLPAEVGLTAMQTFPQNPGQHRPR